MDQMQGLLGVEDPRTLGLLSLGLRLMSTPGKLGTAFGQAGLGALGDVQQRTQVNRESARRDAMLKMQADELAARQRAEDEKRAQAQQRNAYLASIGGRMGPPEPVSAAAGLSAGLDPRELSMLMPQASGPEYKVLGDSLVEIGPKGPRVVLSKPKDVDWNQLIVPGPDGKPTINQALLDAKKAVAAAGKSDVSVSYGAPVEGINPATGKPELFRPENTGGMKPTGIAPIKTDKALTEAQAKAAAFVSQMQAAESELGTTPIDQTKLWQQVEVGMAGGPTNLVAGASAQRARQAQEQWAEAFLRFKTGAASTEDEVRRNVRTYFAQPGDKPEVVAQKKRQREQAVADVAKAAGSGATVGEKTQRKVVRTGTLNGRKVVQYDDGSTEYAD